MGHYVSRKFAMDRLRLGRRQSYRLLPSCYGALINSDEILDLLNAARRPYGDPFTYIPSDIMTAKELASIPELADADLTERKILNWTQNRTKKVPPHFYINRHCIRYSKSRFLAWLDECAAKRKRCAR